MARKVLIVDDIDGSEDAETRVFAFDGKAFEIDLAEPNWTMLQDLLGPFLEAGTVVGKAEVQRGGSIRNAPKVDVERHSREDLDGMRLWANANGVKLPPGGGRVAEAIWQAWRVNKPDILAEKYRLQEGEANEGPAAPPADERVVARRRGHQESHARNRVNDRQQMELEPTG